jgi:hypothetical protein
MIFIPPMEIATRIMTLIDNAETNLVLVSPYISIDNWQKFKKCLQRAVDRGVTITIYARENAQQNLDILRTFKVNLVLVKDLHAKIYLNDSYAIASSQNLIQYSDDNSIDFGYSTDTDKERQQLMGLIKQYLVVSKPTNTRTANVENNRDLSIEPEFVLLKPKDVRQIYEAFYDKYGTGRMNGDEEYVYCTRLFPIADVMMREGLEIRLNSKMKQINSIVETLENLDLKSTHHQFKRIFNVKGGKYGEFMFLPQNVDNVKKLIFDYIYICDKIKDVTAHLVIAHAN